MAVIAVGIAEALAVAIPGSIISVAAVEGVLTVGALVGLSAAGSALAKSLRPDIPGALGAQGLAALNTQAVKSSVKQSNPAQRILYGRQRTGGVFTFYRVTDAGKMYIQHAYSRRKITRVNALNINGNRVILAQSPFDQIAVPLALRSQPDYASNLRVRFQAGTQDQPTNPLLAAAFPDLPEGWRLPGIANAAYEVTIGTDFDHFQSLWGNTQIPEIEPELEGAPVFDPRDPSQKLPDDPDDKDEWFEAQETWKYSENAALIAADYLWQKDGLNAGPKGVDWDKIAEAADRADEPCATRETATTGIYEKRYVAAGVVSLDQQVADVFDGLLTASRAALIQGNNGKVWISHDAPKKPVVTITDRHILGGVTFRAYKGRHDLANKVTTQFVPPDRNYQVSDGPPLMRADLVTEDGGELALQVTLPFTPSPSTVQRIAKADLLDARGELDSSGNAMHGGATWSGVADLELLGIREDDCVEIASKICPHWNGLYIVDEWKLSLNPSGESGIALSLIGYDPANSNNWNASVDDQPFTLSDVDALVDD